jgi:hypothetical protein
MSELSSSGDILENFDDLKPEHQQILHQLLLPKDDNTPIKIYKHDSREYKRVKMILDNVVTAAISKVESDVSSYNTVYIYMLFILQD